MPNLKRIAKEYQSLENSPLPDVSICIPVEENPTYWEITLKGPASTPYSGGAFMVSFEFPDNYPFKPPQILFKTKIYHPNVSQASGEICNDIINENWGPTLNVKHCITELVNLLNNPNVDSPLEDEIASQMRDKPKEFEKTAKKWTKEYAQ